MVTCVNTGVLVLLSSALLGCISFAGQQQFENAVVTDIGSDEHTPLCAEFRLTDNQAQQFLNRSRPINAQQMHDHYSYLPCYVKGRVNLKGDPQQICHFTIRAGGTVELDCDGSKGYVYACDTCDELLTDQPANER